MFATLVLGFAVLGAAPKFTIEQVMSFGFPLDLTAAPKDGKVAWVIDERGARNVWVAEAPDYHGKRLTSFRADDGQEIEQIEWLPDAKSLVYVRGGDFETHRDIPNPASSPDALEQAIWWVPLSGEAPKKLSEGNSPAVSPKGDRIVFLKSNQVWTVGLGGSDKPTQLIHAKGQIGLPRWSPDGSRIIFVNSRTDHSLVGLYDFATKSLRYLDASTDRDQDAVWSPDGRQVAFVRAATTTRAFMFGPVRSAQTPWSIRLADADTGKGRQLWQAQPGPGSAFHAVVAENQLFWGAGNRIVFPWEKTGWVHLYSISTNGDTPTALNPEGEFEVEHVALTHDGHDVLFSTNQGDVDRRHIRRVSVLGEKGAPVTTGDGLEWSPVELSEGHGVAMLHADWKTPARAAMQSSDGKLRDLAPEEVTAGFPGSELVKPQPVMLSAADGMQIHGQLFLPADLKPGERRPAMIFFHGGSRRQMLLGFHYMGYYHNAYAMNQYLANLGYIVLAVNYRSGIGYGLNFREALNYGATGASEFNDVMGAGLYLRNRADVDPKRIGLWGGSYGGYLTALGLARASDLFAVGVDFHGVHDWNGTIRNFVSAYDPGKDVNAARIAFESSPMASVGTWKSPVLLIHGDDDRNVPFQQTVMLVEALRNQGVPFEQLIFPDEIHGFLTHKRWVEAYHASADFMDKYLKR
jgi:dipeptidyl aminopeptidase/acylaminoacyl peptidase